MSIEETLDMYKNKLASGTLTEDESRRLMMFHLLSQPGIPDMEEQEIHEYLVMGWVVSTILKKSLNEE